MSLVTLLWIIILAIFLVIVLLVIRIIAKKIARRATEKHRRVRYEKYSNLVDEIVAEIPESQMTVVEKQPGDENVLQNLLEKKLIYLRGSDRTRVANEIRKLGFVSDYVNELSSPKSAERATALQVLGQLRIVETAGNFVEAFDDKDPDVRLTAVRGLADIVDEMKSVSVSNEETRVLVESIVSLLEKPDLLPGRRLAEIILGLGADAVQPLLVALHSPKPEVRALAADLLGQIGDWKAVEPLIETLSDTNTNVRARAAAALGETGSHEGVKPLISMLKDPAWPVRARASKALAEIGDPVAIHPISQLLSDREWWVRHNAGYALPAFEELGFETLEKNLLNPDRYARERALEVLEDTSRIRKYIDNLAGNDELAKNRAIKMLVIIGNIGGVAPLIEATREVADPQSISSIIEIWRVLTGNLVKSLSSADDIAKSTAIESVNKINFSFVLEKIDLMGHVDIEGVPASVAEIDLNIGKIKNSLVLLEQDTNADIRGEAVSTLSFMRSI